MITIVLKIDYINEVSKLLHKIIFLSGVTEIDISRVCISLYHSRLRNKYQRISRYTYHAMITFYEYNHSL